MRVFDLHCDTISCIEQDGTGLVGNSHHISLERADFEAYAQVFALFLPDELRGAAAIAKYESLLACFRAQMRRYNTRVTQVYTSAELDAVLQGGCVAAILAVEGGSVLAGDLARVECLRNDGVRFLTLTWNAANEIAGGCLESGGLTEFGRKLLPELARYGIVPDVSHLSDQGIDDVLSLTNVPIVATHSNARPICDVPRNLRDEHFKEIVRRGGLVGINFCTRFLRESTHEQANLVDILRHIDHFLAIGGENALALGTDFDGCDVPEQVNSIEKVANLYNDMIKFIPDAAVTKKIFFENARRFCQKNFV